MPVANITFPRALAPALFLLGSLAFGDALPAPEKNNAAKEAVLTFGAGQFKVPETVIHDARNDVYLVSNVNGGLSAPDDNGFISRVSPEGKILDLKWIDGASGPEVVLHGPKDMLLTEKHLIVADVGAVRYFDRETGKPVHAVGLADATLPNALALDGDGETVYVSDTGGRTKNAPGAIYRINKEYPPKKIAEGLHLDRPNGIAWQEDGVVVAPFAANARDLYRVKAGGKKETVATLPEPQIDGLLLLPDDSFVATSWKGRTIYRVYPAVYPAQGNGNGENNARVELVAAGVERPAQIGYDAKRDRLLVPSAMEGRVLVYELAD